MSSITPVHIAQAIGIGGTFWLSGTIISISLVSIPALRQSHSEYRSIPHSTIAQLWRSNFENGKSLAPPIAASVASAFGYLAWQTPSSTSAAILGGLISCRQLYILAALSTVAIVPFTLAFMGGTNDRLIAISQGPREGAAGMRSKKPDDGARGDEGFDDLLARWARLNATRSLLPLLGGMLGMIAAMS